VVAHACNPSTLGGRGGLRQENHLNPGGGGCSEPRLCHCLGERARLCLKKKKKMTLSWELSCPVSRASGV
uniref:Uncharacterized protein n=1 Tax=Theropithecus gelada TaxID=9565 RepID=A0A8D2K4J2_THEGE